MTNIFLAGGTGKTGGRVASRLRTRGVPVRIGSRPLFDWSARSTWRDAIGDSDTAYIAYAPDLAVPAAVADIAEFTEVAQKQGVRRFVLLSGRGEPEAREAEQAMFALAPDATVLRASWLNQNFSEGGFLDSVRSGTVAMPVGSVGEPFVDADDIADAAVAVLLSPDFAGRVFELTGPRLLTFAEAVAAIAAATGRSITYRRISLDDFVAPLPPDLSDLMRYLFGEVFDGRNAAIATGVPEILGRPPRDFRSFAASAAASGVWS